MTETQTPRIILTLGTNAPALSLPGSEQIRGALIDNPSGAWLLLRTTNEYIPPYTLGFARSFEYGHASIAIEFPSTGPAGQISTQQGDNPSVKLFSIPIPNSAGIASQFVEQFTPLLTVEGTATATINNLGGGGIPILLQAAVANKRIRLYQAMFSISPFQGQPPKPYDSGITWMIARAQFTDTIRMVQGRVNLAHPVDRATYAPGLDFPVGAGMQCIAIADFADTFVEVIVTYQII